MMIISEIKFKKKKKKLLIYLFVSPSRELATARR